MRTVLVVDDERGVVDIITIISVVVDIMFSRKTPLSVRNSL